MSDKIKHAYQLTQEECALIRNRFSKHTDWNKRVFDNIKKNIICHLRREQDNLCCYCKRELGFDIKDVDIEHIVPKSTHPEFTFCCNNLALSCSKCNTRKGCKQVLHRTIVNYPRTGAAFKIVHAHFDSYPKHIRIADESVYVALTSKGSETITVCGLYRLNIVEENMKRFHAKRSPLAKITEAIRTCEPKERSAFIEELKQYL